MQAIDGGRTGADSCRLWAVSTGEVGVLSTAADEGHDLGHVRVPLLVHLHVWLPVTARQLLDTPEVDCSPSS